MGVSFGGGFGPFRVSVPVRAPRGYRRTVAQKNRDYAARQRLSARRDHGRRQLPDRPPRRLSNGWDVVVGILVILLVAYGFARLGGWLWPRSWWLAVPCFALAGWFLAAVAGPVYTLVRGTHLIYERQLAWCRGCRQMMRPDDVGAHQRKAGHPEVGWALVERRTRRR